MLKRAIIMQHTLAEMLTMQSMLVIFPNPSMVDFKVFQWASMISKTLILGELLGFTVLFDLRGVILANKAQDHNRTCLKAQRIMIRFLEVTIQDSSGKILGGMIHRLMGHEWAEPRGKIIWHLHEDRRNNIHHLDGSNQHRLGKYALHRLHIEWSARRGNIPGGLGWYYHRHQHEGAGAFFFALLSGHLSALDSTTMVWD